jgi:hypothetical protein
MDDPKVLARSMLVMYGGGAEGVANGYAEKHRRSGDTENQALWLQVVGIINAQQKALEDRNA